MMLRQQRLIQLPVFGVILLCLLVSVYLIVSKRVSKPEPPAKIVKHSVDTPPDDAIKYWTADKMRDTKAADLPNTDALKPGKHRPQRPPHSSRPQHS
jgi:hypothetical protein